MKRRERVLAGTIAVSTTTPQRIEKVRVVGKERTRKGRVVENLHGGLLGHQVEDGFPKAGVAIPQRGRDNLPVEGSTRQEEDYGKSLRNECLL